LFSLFPNRTGIQKNDIRTFEVGRGIKAVVFHDGGNDLTVGEIHLASVTLDVKFFGFARVAFQAGKEIRRRGFLRSKNVNILDNLLHFDNLIQGANLRKYRQNDRTKSKNYEATPLAGERAAFVRNEKLPRKIFPEASAPNVVLFLNSLHICLAGFFIFSLKHIKTGHGIG